MRALTIEALRDGAVCTLVLRGDLDLTAVSDFLTRAALVIDDQAERLVLDLAGVTFLDCAGVRALAAAASFAPAACPVIIRSVSPVARRTLDLLSQDLEVLQGLSPGGNPGQTADRRTESTLTMTDWMSPAGRHRHGFEVPDQVAADLRASGYATASASAAPAHTVTFLALKVRHHGASSVVSLVQVPGVIRALAQALVTWFNGSTTDERLELVARRPDGVGCFRSDSAPSVDRLVSFLRESIWGEDAPPDRSSSDSTERASSR